MLLPAWCAPRRGYAIEVIGTAAGAAAGGYGPGSAVMISYASQCERDRSLRLAQARQELAERAQ